MRSRIARRPFLTALVLAVLVRVVVVIAFQPGFAFSDGPFYLYVADHLTPTSVRPAGYSFLLRALGHLDRGIWLVVVLNHLLGLATGVLIYATLRRRAVSRTVATLASLPVLFDAMELVIEHSVLSDVLFNLLVVAAVAALAWRPRPTLRLAALAGLLIGVATCVRVVGEPVLVLAALFCLVTVPGVRRRLATVAVLVVVAAAPLAAYATWYHQTHDVWALQEGGGRALYMRTTSFVECERFTVPDYEQPLCPELPVGERPDPTFYGWHDPDGSHGLKPPAGITSEDAMRDFAMRAIRAQPGDYVRVVVRDIAYGFDWTRTDRFEYETADKWAFDRYLSLELTAWTRPAFVDHGGTLPTVRQPWAYAMVGYGRVVYTPGPVLLLLVGLAVTGVVRRRGPAGPSRAVIALTGLAGLGLAVAPAVTAEFVWRYQLPTLTLLPMAAALGWTRIRQGNEGRFLRTRSPGPDRPERVERTGRAEESLSPSPPRLPAPTARTAE